MCALFSCGSLRYIPFWFCGCGHSDRQTRRVRDTLICIKVVRVLHESKREKNETKRIDINEQMDEQKNEALHFIEFSCRHAIIVRDKFHLKRKAETRMNDHANTHKHTLSKRTGP